MGTDRNQDPAQRVAFVLGGGGHAGAHEVGMLKALVERGVRPDLVTGTSVGALNGAAIAADPTERMVGRLESMWSGLDEDRIFGDSVLARTANLVRSRTYLHSNEPLRALIERLLPGTRFEDLVVPFQCVAANIERASEHWFSQGPLVDAILASAAIPGLLPVVERDGEHFMDGGLVNSIPVSKAIELGANVVYVLHVGSIDRPLEAPKNPWQVGMVAFEIARRHRFARETASLPPGVSLHVLPTGQEPERFDGVSQLRYRNFSDIPRRIDSAYHASLDYLSSL